VERPARAQLLHNYYWTEHGRSATMNPFYTAEMSGFLRKPGLADMEIA
jgi:hypothetical protein